MENTNKIEAIRKVYKLSLKEAVDKYYDDFKDDTDLHRLRVMYHDAVRSLNDIYTANNPHGDSLYFKRFEIYTKDPEFLKIQTVDEMMGYLGNL